VTGCPFLSIHPDRDALARNTAPRYIEDVQRVAGSPSAVKLAGRYLKVIDGFDIVVRF